jgi:hypothetical protein
VAEYLPSMSKVRFDAYYQEGGSEGRNGDGKILA